MARLGDFAQNALCGVVRAGGVLDKAPASPTPSINGGETRAMRLGVAPPFMGEVEGAQASLCP